MTIPQIVADVTSSFTLKSHHLVNAASSAYHFDQMKSAIIAVLLLCRPLVAQEKSGAICVAPIPHRPPSTAATPELFCRSGNFSLRIDSQNVITWPKDKSISVTGLDLNGSHRVVVLCDGKPHQTFKFRFSEYRVAKACLFLNDLYWTAQLWEPEQAPWCKCNR